MDLPVSQNNAEQIFRMSSRSCVLDDKGRRRLLCKVLNPYPAGSKHNSNHSPKKMANKLDESYRPTRWAGFEWYDKTTNTAP